MTTTPITLTPRPAQLRVLVRRALEARLGILHDPAARYAEDVPALLAELAEARSELARAQRGIRIEERLRLR